MAVGWGQAPRRCQHSQPRRLRYFGRCATAATQAGGGSFVPDGTWDKATREPSDQSLGYFLSPSGLDGGSPASKKIVSGSGKTGLLAANVLRSFPAFIFKNALAAYNGNWGACRFSKAGGRLGGVFTRITRIFTNWGGEISRKEHKDHKMKDLHTASPDISQWGLVFGKNRLKVEKRGAAGSSRAHLNGARSYQS